MDPLNNSQELSHEIISSDSDVFIMHFPTPSSTNCHSSKESINFQASTSSDTDLNLDLQVDARIKNHPLLDGTYFEVVRPVKNITKLEAQCKMCLPKITKIKGSLNVSTNFLKHLKIKHSTHLKKYLEYKLEKRTIVKRKFSDEETKEAIEVQKYIPNKKLKQTDISCYKPTGKINQKDFDNRIVHFVVNTMSAITIIENPSFINLFEGMNVKVMCRKTAIKKISDMYTIQIDSLKNKMKNIQYFCTTADIWSAKKRSFLGITCHWLDDDLNRQSGAIACRRFKGTHSYDKIAEMLEDIHFKFNLNNSNIVATITDNGCNFVKAFKEYGIKLSTDIINSSLINENNLVIDNVDCDFDNDGNREENGNSDDENESIMESLNFEIIESTGILFLPRHLRCATHTLNLVATTDCKNAINSNNSIRTRHTHVMHKCSLLWNKAGKPKSAEIIQDILGHTLSYPGVTRWNSTYDSLSQILSDKENLSLLMERLDIASYNFKEMEILYIEEFCTIMKPLAETLDKLQGENCCFYGYLIPCIFSLKNKWEKLQQMNTFKQAGVILNACLKSLNNRFNNILHLENVNDAVIASVTHPKFKTKWFKEGTTNLSHKNIFQILQDAADLLSVSDISMNLSDESESKTSDDFFDFDEQPQLLTRSSDFSQAQVNKSVNKFELEFLQYLEDKRSDLKMLQDYPTIMKLFKKYNTPLTSSAPVERLFSFASIINAPRRHALSDENFEKLVLLKANINYSS